MYPLQIVLVGCPDPLRSQVRRGLANQSAMVESEFPDVAAALQGLRSAADDRRLFLVYLKSAEDVAQLRRLAGTFADQPILGLRDGCGDRSIFSGALRAGAAFVVPVPLEGDDLRVALNWIGQQYGYTPHEPVTIAVSGVTGGCGTTTLALNIAAEIARRPGLRTVLIDLSLRMGVLAAHLDVVPRCGIHDLLADPDHLDIDEVRRALTPIEGNLELLAGPQEAIREGASWPAVERIAQLVKALADVVVLHVPCTYDDIQFGALAAGQHSVLLFEQKIPAVRALQMVRQALLQKETASAPHLVVNRYHPRLQGFSTADLAKLLRVSRLETIAEDPAVKAAIDHGRLLRQHAPGSPALADLDSLVDRLLPGHAVTKPKAERSGVFARLVQTFGTN